MTVDDMERRLIRLETSYEDTIKRIDSKLELIVNGDTPNCIVHSQRLDNHWTHIRSIWGVLGAAAAIMAGAVLRKLFG